MNMKLTSTAFQEEKTIPKQYTGDGKDTSPPLQWTDPPPNTKSFVLICDDPDAPRPWTHWLLFNLPADAREIQEGMSTEGTLAMGPSKGRTTSATLTGGPAPPKGNPHRYYFKLYALDKMLDLSPGATREKLDDSDEGTPSWRRATDGSLWP